MNQTDFNSAMLGYSAQIMGATADMAMQYNSQEWKEKEAQKVREWNEQMYQRQLEDNRENWRMMNEYNLPSAMLARLRDAGLNPLLYYNNGNAGVVAADSARGATPGNSPAATGDMHTNFGQALQGAALLRAQIENMNADTRQKNAEAARSMDELAFNRSVWDYKKDAYYFENELKSAMYFKTQAERDKAYAETEQALTTIDALETEMYNKTRLTDQEIKESEQRITNSIKETSAIIVKYNAEARKALADAYYNEAMAKIVNDPRYRDAAIKEKVEGVRRAIAEGDSAEIERSLLQFKEHMMPIGNEWYNKAGYAWKKFIELTLGPVGDLLGKVFGGAGAQVLKKP